MSDVSVWYTRAIEALCQIAEAHLQGGGFDAAKQALKYAEELARAPETPPVDRARTLIQLGRVLTLEGSFVTNQYDAPIAALRQAESIARATGVASLVADTLYHLARALYQRTLTTGEGNFDEVTALIQKSLTLREARGDVRGVCEARFYLGLIAERQQRYAEAEAMFQSVRAVAEAEGFRRELADATRHLGFAYWRANEPDKALACFQTSLAILEEVGFRLVLPFAHLSVGETYQMLKQWEPARRHYETGLRLAEAIGVKRATVQLLYSVGEWHEGQGNRAQARPYYEQAYQQAEAIHFTSGKAMISQKLAALTSLQAA